MTFLAVAEARNVTRAAADLRIAQSAVSRTLRELELATGATLFERHSWGVSLTPAGEILAARARAIRAEARAAEREIVGLLQDDRTLLNLGAGPTIAAWRIPVALAHLREARSDLRFRVVEGSYGELLPKLIEGDLDGVVGPLDIAVPDGLATVPLYTDELIAIARADHPFCAPGQRVELARVDWVLPERESELWRQLTLVFKRIELPAPTVHLASESIGFTRAMLHLTDCVSVVPRDLFEIDLAAGRLTALPTEGLPWPRSIGLIHRQSPADLRKLQPFVEAITEGWAARAQKQ